MRSLYVTALLAVSIGAALVTSAPAMALGASADVAFSLGRLTCTQSARPTQSVVMAADPSQYCSTFLSPHTVSSTSMPANTLPASVCVGMAALPQAVAAGMFAVATGGIDSGSVPRAPLNCVPGAMRSLALLAHSSVHHTASSPAHAAAPSPNPARHNRARRSATAAPLNLPAYAPLGAQSADPASGSSDIPGLLIKFGVVMALLFLCLRVLKAIMPRLSGPRGPSSRGIVLHTESIGAKQTVQFLDLGVRIMVISTTGATVTPLTSIDDAAEMEAIRAAYRPAAPTTAAPHEESRQSRPTFAQALAASMASLNRPNRTKGVAGSEAPVQRALAEYAVDDALDHDDPVVARALETVRSLREGASRP